MNIHMLDADGTVTKYTFCNISCRKTRSGRGTVI
jgi:hypothetical protein